MAEDATARGRSEVVVDLLLVRRVPRAARLVIALAGLAACAVVAQLALNAQHHFAGLPTNNRVEIFLGRGSSAATAWPGWLAAFFFAIAVLRLRRGTPEPPAGRAPVESLTANQIRDALFREYTVARIALVAVTAVAALDCARAARYALAAAGGDQLARSTLAATLVEAAGLAAAALVLALWALSFRVQLDRMGALRQARRSTT